MRNSGIGGMQTSAAHYSIICPKCGKPAARMERTPEGSRYMHFTKKGYVWHAIKATKAEEGVTENGG